MDGRMGIGAGETKRPFAAKRLSSETRIEMKPKPNHVDRIGLKSYRWLVSSNMIQRLWERARPS